LKRMIARFGTIFVAVVLVGLVTPCSAQRIGSSPASPAPAGTTVETIIECGEGYESHELYDVKIALLETVRGDRAWEMIRAAAPENKMAGGDFEYILARIRFEYAARGRPGQCGHEVKEEEFTAFSPDGREYDSPSVAPPKPALRGTVHSGESLEGWVVFSVPKAESPALISFGTRQGGGVVHGGDTWFQLR